MAPLTNLPSVLLGPRPGTYRAAVVAVTVVAAAWLSVGLVMRPRRGKKQLFTPSPRTTILPTLGEQEAAELPYPLDALPGGRDVVTPYGSIRVYEWGPEDGERVLLVHGASTPSVALGNLGHEFASSGRRVMVFDLFGRGYSDAPDNLNYDARLYMTQILLVLASSKLPWTEFNLVGYSLGGGLCVSFTRYFPHLVSSLTLLASGGLIRRYHIGWQSRLLYSSGLLPESLVRMVVRRSIRPKDEQSPPTTRNVDIASAETKKYLPNGDSDANGGKGFDIAAISKFRPGVAVSSVVRWQVDHHEGFVGAFLSTIRNSPIYAPQEDWRVLNMILEARRRFMDSKDAGPIPGLRAGKVLMVLGEDDTVIVKDETIEDATLALGSDGVEFAILPGGHELPITMSSAVADTIQGFWRKY
ncbi:alpha/beta-hydrolase [Hypoxylon sp. FL0890]|nr:alpha/beta-hydrolase [Hypoxylon sp. FL0890]